MTILRRNKNNQDKDPVFAEIGAERLPDEPGYVALVPGALVPVVELNLPDAVRGIQREKIVARQLHDLMGLSTDKIGIRPVPDPAAPAQWSRVLVADKAQVAAWRGAAGAGCRAVLPDYMALPAAPGLWSVVFRDGTVRARLGPVDGFSIEPEAARLILARALKEAPPKAILWPGPRPAEFKPLLEEADVPVLDTPEEAARHDLQEPVVLAHGELTCDLRQNPQQERDRLRRLVLPWRWPLLCGLIALGLWCAALVIETQQFRDRAVAIRASTIETARTHFVTEGPILDVRAQVASKLETLRDRVRAQREQTSPLDLMNRAAEVIARGEARVDEVIYDPAGGMTVFLRVDNYAAQDALVAAFRSGGLTVEVVASGLGDDGRHVRAEMALAPAEDR